MCDDVDMPMPMQRYEGSVQCLLVIDEINHHQHQERAREEEVVPGTCVCHPPLAIL
jgi:hypothetical protein